MRFGAIVLVVALVMAAFNGTVDALTITGQDYIWNPVNPSPTHIVGIENPETTTDLLFAWSLGLEIAADAGAIGTLQFASATLPTDYLLDGRSDGLAPAFSGPTTSIAPIGDSDSDFTGIEIPGTGKNLLATTFDASPDAQGVFRIFAVGDSFTGSNWFSSDFDARAFTNAPFTGGPVEIGSITIVPEPTTYALVLCAFLVVGIVTLCRRQGSRNLCLRATMFNG